MFGQDNRLVSRRGRRRLRAAAKRRARTGRPAFEGSIEGLEGRVLLAGDGLSAVYYNNADLTGTSATRVDPSIRFNWDGGSSPAPGIAPYTYSVRWTGQVQPRYSETYTFSTVSDDGVRLWVNGKQLVNNWTRHSTTTNSGQVTLQAGQRYDIRMEFFQSYGSATAKLRWSSSSQSSEIVPQSQLYSTTAVPPTTDAGTGTGTGLAGTYFNNMDFTGTFATRVDPAVQFDWGTNSPAAGISPGTYSVRWAGQVQPRHSENYTFYTNSDDGVRLWVDGKLVIDNWTDHAPTVNSGTVALVGGTKYDIKMEYYQNAGGAVAQLQWSSPSQAQQVIPTTQLYPSALTTPQTPTDPTSPPTTDPTTPPPTDPTAPTPPSLSGTWNLTWSDEFNASTLNPVWHPAQWWDRDHTVVGDGELQAYDASGVSVSNGLLHLTARKEEKYAGTPYVSGLVMTGGYADDPSIPRFSFLHGYMEVRAKLPTGQGLWPAIWMMPASYHDGNGELDVLETLMGDPTRANFTVHRNGAQEGHEWVGPDFSQGYHTFAVDWQADHISWYVDGVERARTTNTALISPEAAYPILNLAVGGNWGGPPNAATQFPATMDVDYIRVWQKP